MKQALIHAEIKNEIEEYQSFLKQYAAEFAFTIEANHKQNTPDIPDNLTAENKIDIQHLPLLNKYSAFVGKRCFNLVKKPALKIS
jgi:hypothetical protein